METLEFENENTVHEREALRLERNSDGSVSITSIVDRNENHGRWYQDSLFEMVDYTLSREQISQVIEFLSRSLEG